MINRNCIKFILLISFIFSACSNPELEKAKIELEEAKCRTEHVKFILENGTNTMLLAKTIGLDKELRIYQELQTDTTITCDSLKKAWSNFSDLVYKKSK